MHLKANKLKYDGSQYHVFVLNSVPITLCPLRSANACVEGVLIVQTDKIGCSGMHRAKKEHGLQVLGYEKETKILIYMHIYTTMHITAI